MGARGIRKCSLIIGPDDWALWMISDADVFVQRIPTGVAHASAQCAYGIKALDCSYHVPSLGGPSFRIVGGGGKAAVVKMKSLCGSMYEYCYAAHPSSPYSS